MTHQPIENYGLIGDTRSAALISITGSLDWLCFPIFDSPTIFAALLDEERGGHFSIAPDHTAAELTHKQFYWPDTNVLVTRFLTDEGVGEVIDFMPIGAGRDRDGRTQIIRQVAMRRGSLRFALRCQPAFNYGRDKHKATATAGGVVFTSPDLAMELASPLPLTIDGERERRRHTSYWRKGSRSPSPSASIGTKARPVTGRTSMSRRRRSSSRPSPTGGPGSPAAPTPGAGVRSSGARRWR